VPDIPEISEVIKNYITNAAIDESGWDGDVDELVDTSLKNFTTLKWNPFIEEENNLLAFANRSSNYCVEYEINGASDWSEYEQYIVSSDVRGVEKNTKSPDKDLYYFVTLKFSYNSISFAHDDIEKNIDSNLDYELSRLIEDFKSYKKLINLFKQDYGSGLMYIINLVKSFNNPSMLKSLYNTKGSDLHTWLQYLPRNQESYFKTILDTNEFAKLKTTIKDMTKGTGDYMAPSVEDINIAYDINVEKDPYTNRDYGCYIKLYIKDYEGIDLENKKEVQKLIKDMTQEDFCKKIQFGEPDYYE